MCAFIHIQVNECNFFKKEDERNLKDYFLKVMKAKATTGIFSHPLELQGRMFK